MVVASDLTISALNFRGKGPRVVPVELGFSPWVTTSGKVTGELAARTLRRPEGQVQPVHRLPGHGCGGEAGLSEGGSGGHLAPASPRPDPAVFLAHRPRAALHSLTKFRNLESLCRRHNE